VIVVGEKLTVFGFVGEECEKNFENHWSEATPEYFLWECFTT